MESHGKGGLKRERQEKKGKRGNGGEGKRDEAAPIEISGYATGQSQSNAPKRPAPKGLA